MALLGNKILLKINDTLLAGQLDSSENFECELSNIIKDGGVYTEVKPERLKMTVSASFNYTPDVFLTLWNAYIARLSVNVKTGGINTGDYYIEGSGYISGIAKAAPRSGLTTINLSLVISGQFSLKTV